MSGRRCEDCYGRFDRPGLFGCDDRRHSTPDPAQLTVAGVESDPSDRRGLRREWGGIDSETRDGIRDQWAEIVRRLLPKELR